jgi:hypothetical protein
MGREIRKVPPNWQHPKRTCTHMPPCPGYQCYQPLYKRTYDDAAQEWLKEFAEFKPREGYKYFWDWNGMPPDKEYYWPEMDPKGRTWFQVYETVSEGTPVTPPFATQEELINYLATNGDFWDQRRGHGPWTRANAEQFVKDEWAPSMIGIPGKGLFMSKDTPTLDRDTASDDSQLNLNNSEKEKA